MKEIKKHTNKKALTKVKEQWFQDGLAFKQIIDYNKVIGGSMWTKEQQEYLDSMEARLNNKIEANAQAIQEVKDEVQEVKDEVQEVKADVQELKTDVQELKTDVQELKIKMSGLQNSVDNILSIIKVIQGKLN